METQEKDQATERSNREGLDRKGRVKRNERKDWHIDRMGGGGVIPIWDERKEGWIVFRIE